MRLGRPRREFHPLAPFFRRRLASLLRRLPTKERAFVRLLPVLFGGRFRRPGFDREPPGLACMPRRRKWGKACEAIDFPPPLGFSAHRPLIRSILLIPERSGWSLVLCCPGDRNADDLRRLDERVQMVRLLLLRHAPSLELFVTTGDLPAEQLFFAGLVAGDAPTWSSEPVDPLKVLDHAPSELARTLSLTVRTEVPFDCLVPGLALFRPERFAAAASSDSRLYDLVRQLEDAPTLDELVLASRIVRDASLRSWRQLPGEHRRRVAPALARGVLSSTILPAFRSALDSVIERSRVAEVRDYDEWRLELDGQPLIIARSLDALRARALSESTRLAPNAPEWRRARTALESGVPKTLFIVEPGFVKHLALTMTGTGRLRARRLTSDAAVRLALSLKAAGRAIDISAKPGADPVLVSRLSQLSNATFEGQRAYAVQRGDRLLMATRGRVRDVPFQRALSFPRQLVLLPERSEWLRALRPPRTVRGHRAVHLMIDAAGPTTAQALFVDDAGAVFAELIARTGFDAWAERTHQLLGAFGATLSLSLSPAVASINGRRHTGSAEPVELDVTVGDHGHATITLDDERFCHGQPMGWRALAETIYSHWPPRTRGRVDVRRLELPRQMVDASPLTALAVRARVQRRLAAHVATLGRLLEVA